MMAYMNGANGSGKRLERKLKGRWVAGVCAGVADYFGIDPVIVRVAFVVASIIWGLGVLAYLAAWVLVPEEGEPVSIVERFINKPGG
jgi:phage shock protein PspC (stress-responsive transcriptional regulator)